MNHNTLSTHTEEFSGDLGGPNGEGQSSAIDMSAFEQSVLETSAAEPTYETLEQSVESPSEVVKTQLPRVEAALQTLIPNTNRRDMLQFSAKLDNKRTAETVSTFTFDKDQIDQTNEDDSAAQEDTRDQYTTRTGRALDWIAEKTDNDAQNREVSGKLYDLAYNIDEEGIRGVAKKALGKLGLAAIRSMKRQIRKPIDGTKRRLDAGNQRFSDFLDKGTAHFEKREQAAKEAKRQAEIASVYDEATAANELYDAHTEAEKMDTLHSVETEAYAQHAEYAAEDEAHQMNADHDTQEAARAAAEQRAYAARLKRARRVLAAKETYDSAKERVSNSVTVARARKIGTAAASIASDLSTYHTAGKNGLKVKKEQQNENQSDYDLVG